MGNIIPVPQEWVESVTDLKFPASADERLQELMDRNTEGLLSDSERQELKALVDLSEELSLVRAQAFGFLHRSPA